MYIQCTLYSVQRTVYTVPGTCGMEISVLIAYIHFNSSDKQGLKSYAAVLSNHYTMKLSSNNFI